MSAHLGRNFATPSCIELISRQPIHRALRQHGLPAQCKTEFRDGRIAGEIHRRAEFIAGAMVVFCRVFLVLSLAPLRRMAGKLDAGVDRERGYTGSRHAEMIRTIVMTGARFGIRLNFEAKSSRSFL